MQEDAESVKLHWRSSEDRVFFIVKRRNQTEEIPISEAFVKGSHVIDNLKDVDDDNEADVALSVAEVDAWHQCSDASLDRSKQNYDTVIQALRVSFYATLPCALGTKVSSGKAMLAGCHVLAPTVARGLIGMISPCICIKVA